MSQSGAPGISTAEPFLVLPENRLAYTAIASLADSAVEPISPIFVYGPSGTGKSHLARHAAWLTIRRNPRTRLLELTGSQLAADLATASGSKAISTFQRNLREADLLVLEDVQGLEGRPESQRQLLSLFDELAASRTQMVITSRKSPGELQGFPAKLTNRFRGGVATLVRLPAEESRASLLEHFARTRQILLPSAATRLLAKQLPVSPRELLAAVLQIEQQSRQKRQPLDATFARRFLERETLPTSLSLSDIAQGVSRHFRVTLAQLRAASRVQGLVIPRQCAMFLSRELTGSSLDDIGQYYGGRDHTTVAHACRRITELLRLRPEIGLHLGQIRSSLGVQGPLPKCDL